MIIGHMDAQGCVEAAMVGVSPVFSPEVEPFREARVFVALNPKP